MQATHKGGKQQLKGCAEMSCKIPGDLWKKLYNANEEWIGGVNIHIINVLYYARKKFLWFILFCVPDHESFIHHGVLRTRRGVDVVYSFIYFIDDLQ